MSIVRGKKYSYAVTFNGIVSSIQMQKSDEKNKSRPEKFLPGFGVLVYLKGRDPHLNDSDTIVIQREVIDKNNGQRGWAVVMENFAYYLQFESRVMESGIYDWASYKSSILETNKRLL